MISAPSSVRSLDEMELRDKVEMSKGDIVKSGTVGSVPFDHKTAYSMYPSNLSPDSDPTKRSTVQYDFSKDPFNMSS